MKTLNVKQISALLHKSVDTIYNDVSRRANSLPPRLIIPGSSKLLWLESDVLDWLEKCREKRKGRPRENGMEAA